MSASPQSKRLACEFLIAAAVCAGLYYFMVDSTKAKIAVVRADAAKAQQEEASHAGIGSLSDAQVGDLMRTTAERVADMKARSAPATDEAGMFTKISDMAISNAVRIEQLNPVQIKGDGGPRIAPQAPTSPPMAPSSTPAAQAAAEGPPQPHDIRVGYSMVVTGKYSDLAAFISSLSEHLGYTIVKSVRMTQPNLNTPDTLRAAIETEHLALDLSGVKLLGIAPATKQPMPLLPGLSVPPLAPNVPSGTHEEANAQP